MFNCTTIQQEPRVNNVIPRPYLKLGYRKIFKVPADFDDFHSQSKPEIMAVEWPTPDAFYIFGLISCFSTPIAILAYFKSTAIRKAHQNLLLLTLLINALMYSAIIPFINFPMLFVKNSDILASQWVY